ncbi:MAG: hypothetical protein L0K42_04915, partial [Acidipropionibacterium jensenii]
DQEKELLQSILALTRVAGIDLHNLSLSKRLTLKTLRTLPAGLRGRVRRCHFWWSIGDSNP